MIVDGGGGEGGGVENSLRRKMTNFFAVIAKSAVARQDANIATYVAHRLLLLLAFSKQLHSTPIARRSRSSYRILNPARTFLIRSSATAKSPHKLPIVMPTPRTVPLSATHRSSNKMMANGKMT